MDSGPQIGHVINHSYDPGFILLSLFVSLTGCWTALELLYRRTGRRMDFPSPPISLVWLITGVPRHVHGELHARHMFWSSQFRPKEEMLT